MPEPGPSPEASDARTDPSPSPDSPASSGTPANSGESGKAEWTPVEPAATAVSTGPTAPMAPAPATATEAAVALEEIDHEAVAALRRLRPAANQKAVWNKRAGRPDGRPDAKARYDTVVAYDDSPAERLITAQAPQRPLSTPIFQMEIDGQTVQGTEGQTILEVCRANGIEVPTLCYEPKLPASGRAGCASSKSRARSTLRSRALGPPRRAWSYAPRPSNFAACAGRTSS